MDGVPDIVDIVLWFLGGLSLIVWTIVIYKGVIFYKESKQSKVFNTQLATTKQLRDLSAIASQATSSLARLCQAGLDELIETQSRWNSVESNHLQALVLHTLRDQAHKERTRLEAGLAVLASIGSTAPFIGLFGTVWGIMHALKNISATGSAGLDVVAGPIGEALIATAIGIATAVPAVLAYNYFLRQIKLRNAEMENFASTFQYWLIKSGLGGV